LAHLGSGASLCALHRGLSVDTTMGFTPLDGLVMGTRCGALDPGVILYLLQGLKMNPAELEDLLYRRSGLLGVSGLSDDMRVLIASALPGAAEAIDLFVFRIVREIGAMAASLGGLDGLVFTGGIGENAPAIRERVAAGLGWLGLSLDIKANRANALQISAGTGKPSAWAIPTDEEKVIARHTVALLN
jgi:acetate kinase